MKLAKRLMALAMAVAMSVAVASCSCGGDKSADTNATTKAATTAASAKATTKAATTAATTAANNNSNSNSGSKIDNGDDLAALPKIKDKVYDAPSDSKRPSDSFIKSVKGYTLKINHPWNFGAKNDASNPSLTYYKQAASYVNSKYGATIDESGKFDDYNKTLQGEIKANKFGYQMYEVQNFYFNSFLKNGYMKDLSAAKKTAAVSFGESWYDSKTTQLSCIDGAQYGWTSFDVEYIVPTGILYNKKLIKNANLTDPMVLARKGQWTWDKLSEYAKALNSSNVKGFRISTKDGGTLYNSLMTAAGTPIVSVSKGASPTSNVMSQTGKDCLQQIQTWIADKTLTVGLNEDWSQNKKLFSEAKIAMVLGSHDTLKSCTSQAVKGSIGMVPFPTKSASKSYNSVQAVQFMSFIPSFYKDDNEAAKIIFLRDEQLQQLYRYREKIYLSLYKSYGLDSDALSMTYQIKYGTKDPAGVTYGKSVSAVTIVDPNGSDSDGTPALTKIVSPVLSGGAASSSISSNGPALQNSYDSWWKNHKFTGSY